MGCFSSVSCLYECGFLVYLKFHTLPVNELTFKLKNPTMHYQTTKKAYSASHLNIAPEEAVG